MKQNIRISPVEPNRGALDFSHLLDAPAGCHGFVRVKKGHFTFEDGKRARFLTRRSWPRALPAWA